MIDYEGFPEHLRKPIPRKMVKDAANATLSTIDKRERAKCHERSGMKCEVWERTLPNVWERCLKRVSDNHHLIGGIGRRNKGKSILAEHRLDVCLTCHQDITANVLQPEDATKAEYAEHVRYERRRKYADSSTERD